jgi:endonuclease/exonuclease/phosphatase family metal-dependent hydrolase
MFISLLKSMVAAAFCMSLSLPGAHGGNEVPGRVHIMTYNVRGLPFPWEDLDRLEDIGRVMQRRRAQGTAPQILMIQEGYSDRINDLIALSGYRYVVRGVRGANGRLGSGLLILSDWPLERERNIVYTHCVGWDCQSRKGAQFAIVDVPGYGPLRLMNTHMNSDPEEDPFTDIRDTREVRLFQIQQIREALWDLRKVRNVSTLLMGDFNFLHGDEAYRAFIALFGAWDLVRRSEVGIPRRGIYDYVFFDHRPRHRVETRRYAETFVTPVNGRPLSDHVALELLIDLRINPPRSIP